MSRTARSTGALLVVVAACALFAEMGVRAAMVVPGDAAATAANIRAAPVLFRAGVVGYLVAFLCDVPVALLFHALTREVDAPRARLAMALRLVYAGVAGASLLPYVAATVLFTSAPALGALAPAQRDALALWCMEAFRHGFVLALAFFGAHLMVLGPLLARARWLPRAFGVLLTLAGAGYALDALALLLAPALRPVITPVVGTLAMSELALALWLLVRGPALQRSPN